MGIAAITQEQSLNVSTNSTSYNLTAFTPGADRILVCVFSLAGTVGAPPSPPVTSTGNSGSWTGYYSNNTTLPSGLVGVYWRPVLTTATSTVVSIATNAGDGATGCNAVVYSFQYESPFSEAPPWLNNRLFEFDGYDGEVADVPSSTVSTYTSAQTPVVDHQYPYRPFAVAGKDQECFTLQVGTADVSSGFTLTPPTGWSSTILAHAAPTVTLCVFYSWGAGTQNSIDGTSFGSTPSSTVRFDQAYQFWSREVYEYQRYRSYEGQYVGAGGGWGQFVPGFGDGASA